MTYHVLTKAFLHSFLMSSKAETTMETCTCVTSDCVFRKRCSRLSAPKDDFFSWSYDHICVMDGEGSSREAVEISELLKLKLIAISRHICVRFGQDLRVLLT